MLPEVGGIRTLTFDLDRVELRQKMWLNELQDALQVTDDKRKDRMFWFAYGMAFMEEVMAKYLSGERER